MSKLKRASLESESQEEVVIDFEEYGLDPNNDFTAQPKFIQIADRDLVVVQIVDNYNFDQFKAMQAEQQKGLNLSADSETNDPKIVSEHREAPLQMGYSFRYWAVDIASKDVFLVSSDGIGDFAKMSVHDSILATAGKTTNHRQIEFNTFTVKELFHKIFIPMVAKP